MKREPTIWIDLDNTPHVPFFQPIIRELKALRYNVVVTSRDAFQVRELADLMGVEHLSIGRHYGKNRAMKVLGLLWRSLQLLPFMLRHRPILALSHGSRSQILLANSLRVASVMVMDYEHAKTPLMLRPRWEIVPTALGQERLQCSKPERILLYEGIKEDVYVPDFRVDAGLGARLGVDPSRIVVTVRPPATEAHYHNRESDLLFEEFMNLACSRQDAQVVMLPRNKLQEARLRREFPQWFAGNGVIVPSGPVHGLSLLWLSDLVVSGGGTMNREAAALGIPVYSIFRGPIGAVDRQLQRQGRLVMVKNVADIQSQIVLKRREHHSSADQPPVRTALGMIVNHVCMIEQAEAKPAAAMEGVTE